MNAKFFIPCGVIFLGGCRRNLNLITLGSERVNKPRRLSQRLFLSILINILRIMKESQYQRYLQEFSSNQELKDFLVIVFVVFLEMIKRDIFPADWMVIKVLANRLVPFTNIAFRQKRSAPVDWNILSAPYILLERLRLYSTHSLITT